MSKKQLNIDFQRAEVNNCLHNNCKKIFSIKGNQIKFIQNRDKNLKRSKTN